jgi:hypothetical protein
VMTNTLTMPSPGKKRASLCELRPRHIAVIHNIAGSSHYHRGNQEDHLIEKYDCLFGPLRPKHKQVPSDAIRKSFMISNMLDLVERRRAELAEADARFNERLRKMAWWYANRTSLTPSEIRAAANDQLEYIRPTKRRTIVEAVVDAAMKMRGPEES